MAQGYNGKIIVHTSVIWVIRNVLDLFVIVRVTCPVEGTNLNSETTRVLADHEFCDFTHDHDHGQKYDLDQITDHE